MYSSVHLLVTLYFSVSVATDCTSHDPCWFSISTYQALPEKPLEYPASGPRILGRTIDKLQDEAYHIKSVDEVNSTSDENASSTRFSSTPPLVINVSSDVSTQISTTPILASSNITAASINSSNYTNGKERLGINGLQRD